MHHLFRRLWLRLLTGRMPVTAMIFALLLAFTSAARANTWSINEFFTGSSGTSEGPCDSTIAASRTGISWSALLSVAGTWGAGPQIGCTCTGDFQFGPGDGALEFCGCSPINCTLQVSPSGLLLSDLGTDSFGCHGWLEVTHMASDGTTTTYDGGDADLIDGSFTKANTPGAGGFSTYSYSGQTYVSQILVHREFTLNDNAVSKLVLHLAVDTGGNFGGRQEWTYQIMP